MSDEPIVEEGLLHSEFSRRSLIKAGAIVGGTVWVAPVIDSFVSRAAAASLAHFPCSYADIIYSSGGSLFAVKLTGGVCTASDNDGMYDGSQFPVCNGVVYGVNKHNVLSTVSGTTFTTIPAGSCSAFTVNGCTVSWTSAVTVEFVLIHDGSLGACGVTGPKADTHCATFCGPSGSFTVPSGKCSIC